MTPRRIALEELLASERELADLHRALTGGGVVALPTETFYALAADPTSERGVSRVFELKGRDDGKPLLVLAADREQIEALGIDAPSGVLERFLPMWPAPLTVVLPLRESIAASRRRASLAVRIPDLAPLRRLLARTGPLTGTSANRSGAAPPCDPDEVARELPGVDLLVDGGATPGGVASTIVDATVEPPRVLREGAFVWQCPPE